ncbi:MAG: hypothetical protein GX557_14755 [Chloroflexi bacterium]|nr:hypothetical protein [Chloroflexota bacterium]
MLTQTRAMGLGLPGFAHGFIEWDTGAASGMSDGGNATSPPRALGHGGNTACFSTQVNIVPAERFGVVVLANAAGEMALTSGITEALIGDRDWPTPVAGDLPPASAVAGTYLPARRAHNTILKVYAYLQLLTVESLDTGRIVLRTGGQSGAYVQVAPYRCERVAADGAIFEHNLRTIHSEMDGGRVRRMSGDFTPLPRLHTIPWLVADMVALALAVAFLLLAPIVLGAEGVRRRCTGVAAPGDRIVRRSTDLVHLVGVALVANVAVLVLRLLNDNYRSFAEVRPQVLVNYGLAAVFALAAAGLLWRLRRSVSGGRDTCVQRSAGQRARAIATIIAGLALLALMLKWGFFDLLC